MKNPSGASSFSRADLEKNRDEMIEKICVGSVFKDHFSESSFLTIIGEGGEGWIVCYFYKNKMHITDQSKWQIGDPNYYTLIEDS